MKSTILCVVLASTALSGAVAIARAYDPAEAKRAITGLYQLQDTGYTNRKADAAYGMRSKEYEREFKSGKTSREDEFEQNKKFLEQVQKVNHWTTKILTWDFRPYLVVVRTSREFEVDYLPPPNSYKVKNVLESMDYWAKTRAGWKIVRSRELKSKDYLPK